MVAIIAILAAMLLPALGVAREHARRAVCLSNLRQFTLGIVSYADDLNGRLPTGVRDDTMEHTFYLHTSVYAGIKEALSGNDWVMDCPNGYPTRRPAQQPVGVLIGYFYLGGHSASVTTQAPNPWTSPALLSDPPSLPLVSDGTECNTLGAWTGAGGCHSARGAVSVPGAADPFSIGVQGGNVGLLDGSVNWVNARDMVKHADASPAFPIWGYW